METPSLNIDRGKIPLCLERFMGYVRYQRPETMYEGGKIEAWETPFGNAASLVMVSLVDDGKLTITLEDARHPRRMRYRVIFDPAPNTKQTTQDQPKCGLIRFKIPVG